MKTNRRNINFEDLRFRKHPPKPLKRKRNHPVMGMDTETYRGTCKLLTDSDGEHIQDATLDELLQWLTRKNLRVTHIFYYNMDFDVQSILKMLPRPLIQDLYEHGECEYYEYRIKYIPKKMFTITKAKHVSRFYDLWQFYESKLEVAALKYLGVGKDTLPFETGELNVEMGIWKEYEDTILEYCIKDSVLCQRLGMVLQDCLINKIGLKPQNYISRAALSKHYFRNNADIPDVRKIRKNVLRLAFYAYKGGRFELLKKGHFDHVELYDIKSAYPSTIRNLIDVTKGEWRWVTEVNPEAHYGFYLCDLNLKYRYISPLPYVMKNDVLAYPFGTWRTVVTKEELLECLEPSEYKVLYGYEFYPAEISYPFRAGIDKLFKIKNNTDEDEYLYELTKRIMNSLYGSFYEKIKKPGGLSAGKLFNPVYASLITAATRVQSYKYAKQREQDVISFATDSVAFAGEQKLPESNEIGGWELKAEGPADYIMSGLYRIDNKIKTRGFKKATKINTEEGEFNSIFDYIQVHPEKQTYKGTVKRPLHLIESLLHSKKYTIDDVNIWMPEKRTLDINKDIKRIWDREFLNGGQLWEKTIDSHPLYVNDPQASLRAEAEAKEKEFWDEAKAAQRSVREDRRRIKKYMEGLDVFEIDSTLERREQVDDALNEMRRFVT